jgi:type II secretory pathway component GspD/PulD (secretin)
MVSLSLLLLIGAAAAAPVNVSKDSLYSVDASSTDVRLVLEALARQSGVNMVVSPEVTGDVSAQLKQMPIDTLLDRLSAAHGFAWTRNGETYIVSAKGKDAPPEAAMRPDVVAPPPPAPEPEALVWRCRHVKAEELATTLSAMFANCKIAAGPSGISPKLQDPLSGASAATGAATSGSGASSTSSGGTESNAATVILYGDAKEIARAKALLEKIDVPRPTVSIEVAVTEISSSASRDLGLNWSWSDLVFKEGAGSGIQFGNLAKQPVTFTATLAALATTGNAHLLAQPNMSVIDGGCADILIGDRILFPKLVGYTQFGTPIYDKEEERVGIYLQIAPRVTDDDAIVLTVYPQVSLVTKYLKTQAGDYPQISTREARTTVPIKSGCTLAIGGLIQDNDIKNGEKVPLLGDLPIIGQFFRHSKTTKERTEIVIFLTPKIVQPGA